MTQGIPGQPKGQLPPGRYAAKMIDHYHTYTRAGAPCIKVQFQVMPGNYDGSYCGKTIESTFSLSDAALPITVRQLRACGWVGDDIRKIGTAHSKLVTMNTELNEKGYAQVKGIWPLGWGMRKENPMSQQDHDALANLAGSIRRADVENAAREEQFRADRQNGGGYHQGGGQSYGGSPSNGSYGGAPPPAQSYQAPPPVAATVTDDENPF